VFAEMQRLASEQKVRTEVIKAAFFSAVWRREIRIDLFRPVLVDRPLRPERVDPIVRYASWFER
jgi:hypothetical protein